MGKLRKFCNEWKLEKKLQNYVIGAIVLTRCVLREKNLKLKLICLVKIIINE